mmetsp:Transcript_2908/g.7122  ORF Transcript_2908/g.7122 Transcript_2908/m.7122 type:complete len:240 (-) Transcript_2908:162-881(-)
MCSLGVSATFIEYARAVKSSSEAGFLLRLRDIPRCVRGAAVLLVLAWAVCMRAVCACAGGDVAGGDCASGRCKGGMTTVLGRVAAVQARGILFSGNGNSMEEAKLLGARVLESNMSSHSNSTRSLLLSTAAVCALVSRTASGDKNSSAGGGGLTSLIAAFTMSQVHTPRVLAAAVIARTFASVSCGSLALTANPLTSAMVSCMPCRVSASASPDSGNLQPVALSPSRRPQARALAPVGL